MGHRLCVPALLVARVNPGCHRRAGALVGRSTMISSRLELAAGVCRSSVSWGDPTAGGGSSSPRSVLV